MEPTANFISRGVAIIFYIRSTDQLMFFLRDDKPTIPCPNMVDIIGGHMEDGETPMDTVWRELAEELDDLTTGSPFRPDGIVPFKTYVDHLGTEQNVFSCELPEMPNLRLNEGQRLVFLKPDEVRNVPLAFDFNELVEEYIATLK